jgi:hypothetical protein
MTPLAIHPAPVASEHARIDPVKLHRMRMDERFAAAPIFPFLNSRIAGVRHLP